MNYYPLNIGDYAAHTAHLAPLEDLAYRRMLDLYYLKEAPLAADPAAVARLIRMKPAVVAAVLNEFFVLTENGWANARCDAELEKMRGKLDAHDEKEQHEKNRMQRYRERRSAMFEALRGRGIVPVFDIGIKELERLFDENCSAGTVTPATPAVTPAETLVTPAVTPVTPPATAIPRTTPTPRPTPGIKDTHPAAADEQPPGEPDGSARVVSVATAVCMAMKAKGIGSTNPAHPDLKVLIDSGADIGLFVEAAKAAVKKQKGFTYALGIVGGQMRDAAALAQTALATPQHHAGQPRNPNKQEALEASNNAVAARFLERMGHAAQ